MPALKKFFGGASYHTEAVLIANDGTVVAWGATLFTAGSNAAPGVPAPYCDGSGTYVSWNDGQLVDQLGAGWVGDVNHAGIYCGADLQFCADCFSTCESEPWMSLLELEWSCCPYAAMAIGLNNAAEVVGRDSGHPVLWRQGSEYDISRNVLLPPTTFIIPADINDAGRIISGRLPPYPYDWWLFKDPYSTESAGSPYVLDPCQGDVTIDGSVGVSDLLDVLNSWGACENCIADLDGSQAVDVADLLELLSNWGPCE